ncbi:MAG: amidohydrolase [Gammaproteobacteria bacterium]|nr:amidohydrolase [Gammaproteobacteria bacterium]
MQLIDVHCHVSPQNFPPAPSRSVAARWPCMRCEASKASLYVGEKMFRELDERSWNPERRLEDMARDQVAIQVLSPMPELLSYGLKPAEAAILCDHSNQQIAEMITLHPSHFRGLGAITLQQPDRAQQQLLRLKSEFGLAGVEIGSNINGTLLGDKSLEPFWAAADSLNMAVFVHALHPIATAQLPVSPMYTALAGFPTDVGMAAASIIMSGVLERYPQLRIAFSHGGGTLGAMLGRLDLGWRKTEGFGGVLNSAPSEQARRCFFDSNVYDGDYLRLLATTVAPKRIILGTDYPYAIQQESPQAFLRSAELDDTALRSLSNGAAMEFLNEVR